MQYNKYQTLTDQNAGTGVSYRLLNDASSQFDLFGVSFPIIPPHSSVDPRLISSHNHKPVPCENIHYWYLLRVQR